jgi:hypothetical protein
MKPPTEAEITSAIRALLKSLGVFAWKNWSGPMSSPKGIADILGCWKGRFVAIEVKRPGGRISQEQERFLEAIRRHGGIGFVARSVEDVIESLGVQDRFLFTQARSETMPSLELAERGDRRALPDMRK